MATEIVSISRASRTALTAADFQNLERRWITPEIAEAAGLYRVTPMDAAELFSRRPTADLTGVVFPYRSPWEGNNRGCRLRRDAESRFIHITGSKDDAKPKYEQPAGQPNMAYFPPDVTVDEIDNSQLIVITEGEFKTLALGRLARHESKELRFLALGLGGVWNWCGKVGKAIGPDGNREDEKGVIPDLRRMSWEGRRVIIAFDADSARNAAVKAARFCFSRELRSVGAEVAYLEWSESRGKGIDDWLAAEGPVVVLNAIDNVNFDRTTGWKAKLRQTDKGKIKALQLNAEIALRSAPEWDGVIAYNEFRNKIQIVNPAPIPGETPRDWCNADDIRTASWLQSEGIEVGKEIAGSVVQALALENQFNPLRDWLDGLYWDEQSRVDSWLSRFMGAESNSYTSAVGRMWLISAVARVFRPGCKVDHMIVLEGAQGIGKSLALKTLAGEEYFSDSELDMHDKDSQMKTLQYWILEWGELEALRKAEMTAVKAFITRTNETLRRPYGHHVEDIPRQCVFAGTTNKRNYLQDETGNRRFWPVHCTKADVAGLARDRNQIWAEAVELYRSGVKWWPEDESLMAAITEHQQQRVDTDPWMETIEGYVSNDIAAVRCEDILNHLGIPKGQWTQIHKNRVGRCLRILGFEFGRNRNLGRCYTRVGK